MPKERLRAGGDVTFVVEVGWAKNGGEVQVATTVTDAAERLAAILTEHGLKLVDAHTKDLAGTAQIAPAAALLAGWHTTLPGRWDVNRLIRVLKTARDGAFGKDE